MTQVGKNVADGMFSSFQNGADHSPAVLANIPVD